MTPSRFPLVVLVAVCSLLIASMLGASPAEAATHFGSPGADAGQLTQPLGVATDAAGDIYVSDLENDRVNKFDRSTNFLFAWGEGVADGLEEPQTCTSSCQRGVHGALAGGFELLTGVAVDASGNVYVHDFLNFRVEKFDSEGKFILMFGGHVDQTTGANVCTAASGDTCAAGTSGTADAEFSLFNFGSDIATGPGGDVYVADSGRVQVFQASGAWKENISLAGLAKEEEGELIPASPGALAVDSTGDVFVQVQGVEGVREFDASGTEMKTQFDPASTSVGALAIDPAGNLYVGEENGGFHVLKYDAAGTEVASFGAKTVSGPSRGIAFSASTGDVYASELEGPEKSIWVLTPPPPGPLIDSQSATPGLAGDATLEAQVNPEGHETSYHFAYVDQAHFLASGYTTATSTPPVSIGSSFEDQAASIELSSLLPGETYHWRVVATDSLAQTTTGADQSFEETPAALIDGPWTENVASTSATLTARINPLKANTDYRLEYGTTTSYQHVLSGNVGEGAQSVPISHHLQELQPNTTYHYRLVTSSLVGTVQGADHTFTTQPETTIQPALPDGRAWELVSPADSKGALLVPRPGATAAASDGSMLAFPVKGAPLGENIEGHSYIAGDALSRSGPSGWRTQDIALRVDTPAEKEDLGQLLFSGDTYYPIVSPDLSSWVVEVPQPTSLSSQALKGTPYLREADGTYEPLLTQANTPAGTDLEVSPPGLVRNTKVTVAAGTPDTGHIILGSQLKLTEDANQFGVGESLATGNLYEWSGGHVQLVNHLPGTNKATSPSEPTVELAGGEAHSGQVQRVVSDDGRWVAWTIGWPYVNGTESSGHFKGLYLRDTRDQKSVRVGGQSAHYQTMNSDGSRVFFLEGGELFEYDTGTEAQTDLTAQHGAGEASAGVQESVSDVSEDGSYVYFVATGKLTEGAVAGADNLYLLHESGGSWSTSLIATLASDDQPSWHTFVGIGEPHLTDVGSRVSPNGRYLAFMSTRSLTGYDNNDASSPAGEPRPDAELYLYDAASDRLVCASCNPSGARPSGVFTGRNDLFVGGAASGGPWSSLGHPHWVAALLPGWALNHDSDTVHQARYLSDSGRLFFDSPDALVPHDTNGLEDVYQYEPAGVGGCASATSAFNPRTGGCVDAISSGTSSAESAFMDASENGDDVFFLTSSQLTSAEDAGGYHVWDAHVCSAARPCVTATASPPACSSGDSCKAAPGPQPELFGPAPSATFSGVGNPAPAAASTGATTKPLTRAQKLAKALKACKKKKRRQRPACERNARKRFASHQSRKKNAIKRGGK